MKTEDFLEILVSNQQRAIRQYKSLSTAIFVSGAFVLIFFLLSGQTVVQEPMKTIFTISGGFVSSISIFPLKEINSCKDKLDIYLKFKLDFVGASDLEKEKIASIVSEAIKKNRNRVRVI